VGTDADVIADLPLRDVEVAARLVVVVAVRASV
jgi:hypothetical protein